MYVSYPANFEANTPQIGFCKEPTHPWVMHLAIFHLLDKHPYSEANKTKDEANLQMGGFTVRGQHWGMTCG